MYVYGSQAQNVREMKQMSKPVVDLIQFQEIINHKIYLTICNQLD